MADRLLDVTVIGGEAQVQLAPLVGSYFHCTCSHVVPVGRMWSAYVHVGGSADGDGTRWWFYLVCTICQYQWSAWKVIRRVKLEPD